ncbi:MAG: hypothetical protein WAU32_11615 [Thermoanaerobaculia bacterium]
MRKQLWKHLIAVACAVSLACNAGKAPAEAALKAAEDAVNSARAQAEKLVPDDFKSLTDDLAAAKDLYNKGDYKGALAAAQSIQQKANEVTAKALARKTELTKAWNEASAEVPKTVEELKGRLDTLSKSKKLPKGLEAATVASAKDSLDAATAAWGEAQSTAAGGNLTDAIAKANAAKAKASEALAALGTAGAPAPAK